MLSNELKKKFHKDMSTIKSMLRLAGYVLLPFNLWVAVGMLILSEIVGLFEEIYE